jgi:hypothetical protein
MADSRGYRINNEVLRHLLSLRLLSEIIDVETQFTHNS